MFLTDIIKIMYVNIGYLPNYPYHMISDKEMIDAFRRDDGVFNDYYPCPDPSLEDKHMALKLAIWKECDNYLENNSLSATLPAWVLSFMLLRPISVQSDELDIAYLYELTNVEPESTLTEFSAPLASACYDASEEWIKKKPSLNRDRPPSIFGETHVTKCLRLKAANLLIEPGGS